MKCVLLPGGTALLACLQLGAAASLDDSSQIRPYFTEPERKVPRLKRLEIYPQPLPLRDTGTGGSSAASYAPRPNDPYYRVLFYRGAPISQWYLENRDEAGHTAGLDLNVRAAWPLSTGAGVTLAIGDCGVELTHPDLVRRTAGAPHYNFNDGTTNATPELRTAPWQHGTTLAGLAAAEANDRLGLAGVAPAAQVVSWVVVKRDLTPVAPEVLAAMFQHDSNRVHIQNHSWTSRYANLAPIPLQPSVTTAISNAVTFGRQGRGVVIVRAAGNTRSTGENVNDDPYPADPRVIAVAAVGTNGHPASYSRPGAPLLVAAPGGDDDDTGLCGLDLTGADGANTISFRPPDSVLSNYVFGAFSSAGTSFATPLVSGIAALILSANPALGYRDVQQILLHSARHFDVTDPDLTTNAAGFVVSHSAGFGVPDAGHAVALAQRWQNRPALARVVYTNTIVQYIPNAGLRLHVLGDAVPAGLQSIVCGPSQGPQYDEPGPALPLVDVGLATNSIEADLTGKAALIQRGTNLPAEKITLAAAAGASFAVVYNFATNPASGCPGGGDQLCPLPGTDFTPIPAVFIGYWDGIALRDFTAAHPETPVQIAREAALYQFDVTTPLSCEHVGVQVKTDYPNRGDLRITLLSPGGTRSVLQRFNADLTPGPVDWTYYSTHHFYESSQGTWEVAITDEYPGGTGTAFEVNLVLSGVRVEDADADGLDDGWERDAFGSLAEGPRSDPDEDGYNNAREQAMDGNAAVAEYPLTLALSSVDADSARLSWPGVHGRLYEIAAGSDPAQLTFLTNVTGQFPVTEWVTPYAEGPYRFFQLQLKQ